MAVHQYFFRGTMQKHLNAKQHGQAILGKQVATKGLSQICGSPFVLLSCGLTT
jgi:hypothetical protein